MANAHDIARSCGIRLLGKRHSRNGHLKPKTTHSRGTIKSIARDHGANHACMVLEAITSAPHNETQLFGETIKAVSLWLSEGGYGEADAPQIYGLLATVNLAVLRSQVIEVKLPERSVRMADRLAAMMQNEMEWAA